MSRIFISHSSKDNFAANAVAGWLATKGWDDVFLDIDPERGIRPGERWARALHEAAHRCQAVIFLISRNWLASEWCDREFNLAVRLNKQLFGVIIDDTGIGNVPQKYRGAWQLLDLTEGTDHQVFRAELKDGSEGHVTFSAARLDELREGLRHAGLDPEFFRWPPWNDPHRAPYRGLNPLEAEDAGIFFGREAQLVDAMGELRGMRPMAAPRILTILGASGAGKSSFLRAGLLPRLERDDRAFRVLKIVRPQGAPLSGEFGLVSALAAASPDVARATIESEVKAGGEEIVRRITTIAPADGPTLTLPIDQAEELFGGDAGPEAEPFLKLLRALAENRALPLLVLLTIRTDRYVQWQESPLLNGFDDRTFSLAPVPRGAYRIIIEEPIARYVEAGHELKLDPRLTAALLTELEEGESPDALPILAFTLEQLFKDFHASKELSLDNYNGLRGAISAAVTRALAIERGDPANGPPTQAQLGLLRQGLIPALAGIDPTTKTARRKTALWTDIPEGSRSLIDRLVNARLLRSDVNANGDRVVEPAHEAILRQWADLDKWLKDDIPALSALDGVKDAAQAWIANRRDAGFLAHAGSRLVAAEGLNQRKDLARNLTDVDKQYLATCRMTEDDRQNRLLRRTVIGLVATSVAAVVALGFAVFGLSQRDDAIVARNSAVDARLEADAQRVRIAVRAAPDIAAAGDHDSAWVLLLDSAQRVPAESRDALTVAMTQALNEAAGVTTFEAPAGATAFEGRNNLYLYDPVTGDMLAFDGEKLARLAGGQAGLSPVVAVAEFGEGITFLRADLGLWSQERFDTPPKLLGRFAGPAIDKNWSGRFVVDPDGTVLLTTDGTQLFDPLSASILEIPEDFFAPIYFPTPEGTRLIVDKFDSGGVQSLSAGGKLAPTDWPGSPDRLVDQALFRACFARTNSPVPDFDQAVADVLSDDSPYQGGARCLRADNTYIVSVFMDTSGGNDRADFVFSVAGETEAPTQIEEAFFLPDEIPSWVGLTSDPEGGDTYALLSDREALLSDGARVTKWIENEAPQVAKLFADGRLALAEDGKIVVLDRTRKAEGALALDPSSEVVRVGEKKLTPLNPGTCARSGEDDGLADFAATPAGISVSFGDRLGPEGETLNPFVRIGDHEIDLPASAGCVQVSPDFKLMALVEYGERLQLFDFEKLREGQPLEAAEIATLNGGFGSAFPLTGGDSLVTTGNMSERESDKAVLEWTRGSTGEWVAKEIYRSDKWIAYAEPDRAGQSLLIKEDRGLSDMHGYLVSLAAPREPWIDFGNNYKWLRVSFSVDEQIVVAKPFPEMVVGKPHYEELLTAVRQSLRPGCEPRVSGDYRTSPCWPDDL